MSFSRSGCWYGCMLGDSVAKTFRPVFAAACFSRSKPFLITAFPCKAVKVKVLLSLLLSIQPLHPKPCCREPMVRLDKHLIAVVPKSYSFPRCPCSTTVSGL